MDHGRRILVLGGDGYLGWPAAMHFSVRGCEVAVVDSYVKRRWENLQGVRPLATVPLLPHRVRQFESTFGRQIPVFIGDIASNYRFIIDVLQRWLPDTIVHFAEQPSAPFSMDGHERALETQVNNVAGTLNIMFAVKKVVPDAHIIKLGTMGEYGTPNIPIEEGWLTVHHEGRTDRMLFPKKPGSFYHLSKVHDSHNLEFAARVWGLRVTDLNQGVVYGTTTPESSPGGNLRTSFHYDSVFGTVINRFVVQAAVGCPLTVYGSGGQTRGYLNILDTLACVELATKNPAAPGEFRVFNQMTEQFSVQELARRVIDAAGTLGLNADVQQIPNPRWELEEHFYEAKHSGLPELGLEPHPLTQDTIASMIEFAIRHASDVDRSALMPSIKWEQ